MYDVTFHEFYPISSVAQARERCRLVSIWLCLLWIPTFSLFRRHVPRNAGHFGAEFCRYGQERPVRFHTAIPADAVPGMSASSPCITNASRTENAQHWPKLVGGRTSCMVMRIDRLGEVGRIDRERASLDSAGTPAERERSHGTDRTDRRSGLKQARWLRTRASFPSFRLRPVVRHKVAVRDDRAIGSGHLAPDADDIAGLCILHLPSLARSES